MRCRGTFAPGDRQRYRRSEVFDPRIVVLALKKHPYLIDALFRFHMTPSEFTQALAAANDRIRSLLTGAVSLLALAVLAIAATSGVHRLAPGLGRSIAVLGLLGGLGLLAGGWFASLERRTIYEDIILAGFRHVSPHEVTKRAAYLVGATSRLRLAGALDRFLEAARMERVAPVPVNREAMLACAAQAQAIAGTLRALTVDVEPAGMVLLQRLVTDG